MSDIINDLLKRNHLSVTESRRKILELFNESGIALSHSEIEQKTSPNFDRVTVYRTLQTFVEKGILHSITTPDNSAKYALCKDECGEGHHHDNHVHFVCDECGTTYCLDDVSIPRVDMPSGFKAIRTDVVVSGICKSCEI